MAKWERVPTPNKGAFAGGGLPSGIREGPRSETTVTRGNRMKQSPNTPKPTSPSRLPKK